MQVRSTHRLRCSSFLGLPYRILSVNHEKELLWSTIGRGVSDEVEPRIKLKPKHREGQRILQASANRSTDKTGESLVFKSNPFLIVWGFRA